ncbi:transporter [Martiniozyma asiatica (nom. inval.)]|nr:transporter [Martiniozyma asiatica]
MSYYQQYQNNMNPYNTQQSSFSMPTGVMDTPPPVASGPLSTGLLAAFSTAGYPGEPPLLTELGVNFDHIKAKTLSVLGVRRTLDQEVVNDSDLAGPILFCFLFAVFLLLSGKEHFGYIYGVALFGTISLHILFKLMSNESGTLEFLRTASVLGYCLLPLVILSGLAVLLSLDNAIGYFISFLSVGWCSYASSGLFVRVLGINEARPLVAYPLAMFYSVFALMAIFVEKTS